METKSKLKAMNHGWRTRSVNFHYNLMLTFDSLTQPVPLYIGCYKLKYHLIYLKQKQDYPAENKQGDAHLPDAVKTIFVSGIKETTTHDAVTMFFQNKRRSRGGELCPGEEGYKRLSLTVARLTFLSSKGTITIFLYTIVCLRSPLLCSISLCSTFILSSFHSFIYSTLIFPAVTTLLNSFFNYRLHIC